MHDFAELLATHRSAEDTPWVDLGGGAGMRLVYVNRSQGQWIVQNVFQAGFEVQPHRHTGPVWGFTLSGAWKYKEYDYVNRAGSFLFEPAGSVHTLQCIEDDTVAWFYMTGVNLNLDADGNVESVTDGDTSLAAYIELCEAQGLGTPNVVVL